MTMKRLLLTLALLGAGLAAAAQNDYAHRYTRSLHDILTDISTRFGVRLKCEVDTVGRTLPYAASRIRPYSLDETLTGILGPFDFHYVREGERIRIKAYEYNRRTGDDGRIVLRLRASAARRAAVRRD